MEQVQESLMAVRKYCPVDGQILYKKWEEDLECYCWECPACGYIEPILE